MHRKAVLVLSVVVLALIMVATTLGCGANPAKEVTIGSKNFTEQYIVGEMIKQLLEDRGFAVKLVSGLSTPDLREGMENGEIDICAEYTGTAWIVHLAHMYEPGMDNNDIYQLVKKEDKDNGFVWLSPIWNDNTYVLASWPEFVEEHGLKTLSDLAALYREMEGKINTCVGLEFSMRPDGLPALQRHYDFNVAQSYVVIGRVQVPQESLKEHKSCVAMVFGTDAAIAQHGWHIYTDDKAFFPSYDLTPYVRKEIVDKYPELFVILNELVATFPGGGEPATPEIVAECQKVWQQLNARVSIDRMEPGAVAHEYLVKHGLIKK